MNESNKNSGFLQVWFLGRFYINIYKYIKCIIKIIFYKMLLIIILEHQYSFINI